MTAVHFMQHSACPPLTLPQAHYDDLKAEHDEAQQQLEERTAELAAARKEARAAANQVGCAALGWEVLVSVGKEAGLLATQLVEAGRAVALLASAPSTTGMPFEPCFRPAGRAVAAGGQGAAAER